MEGLVLDSFKGELGKVADEFALNPALTIANIEQKLAKIANYLDAYFDEFDFLKNYTDLPFKAFAEFSFEDICKLRFSASTMMHSTVEKTFEENVNYELFRKIKSSWWRWGVGKGTWNELVDVYNGIRNFSLDLPEEFEIRLDYTTGYNPQGGSKFSYTYLDGVFGFLVHYHGKHVMTIGFSVIDRKSVV